jgi:hypothetical protein
MYKMLTGMAAAAVLSFAMAPAPAAAAPIQNAAGLSEAQTGVELVQRRYRRHWRGHRYYAPRRAYRYYGPAPYAYAPYPYYRPYYYGPRGPHIQLGPFGFGAW